MKNRSRSILTVVGLPALCAYGVISVAPLNPWCRAQDFPSTRPNAVSPSPAAPVAQPSLSGELEEILALVEQGDVLAAHARTLFLLKLHPDEPKLVTLAQKLSTVVDKITPPAAAPGARKRIDPDKLPVLYFTRLKRFEQTLAAAGERPPEKKALEALLAEVQTFTKEQPDVVRGWIFQAQLAMVLDRAAEGKAAGRNLYDLRAMESTSEQVKDVLDRLIAKGWMTP